MGLWRSDNITQLADKKEEMEIMPFVLETGVLCHSILELIYLICNHQEDNDR